MNLLLDTHCIIWLSQQASNLSDEALRQITHQGNCIHVSPISSAEIACLYDKGKFYLTDHWKTWFNAALSVNQWEVIDISLPIIQEAYSLPGEFHPDPADRTLVATARIHDLHLVTADRKILAYPHVNTIW